MNELDQAIYGFMQRQIHVLFPSKAALASLRRGVGRSMGERPDLLGLVLPDTELSEYKRQEMQIERALYTALTLYAFHQQGNDDCVSQGTKEEEAVSHKNSFGYAVRKLAGKTANKEGVLRRFDQVLTANDLTELAVHARALISMMRQNKISFDYSGFAVALYHFQQPGGKKQVVLTWGKDFYMHRKEE